MKEFKYYSRKAEMAGNEHSLSETFAQQLDEFNQRFEQLPESYNLFFGWRVNGFACTRCMSGLTHSWCALR
jgi:hypothetical protein